MKTRVLIVDDEPAIVRSFEIFLAKDGYEPVSAKDAQEADGILAAGGVDVVLTDIKLGRTCGLDLLERIREESDDVPVILITGQPSVDSAAKGVRLGAFDYITKPVEKEDLLRAVSRAAEHRRLVLVEKKLTREVARREETVRALLNATTESALLMTPDGTAIFANDTCAVNLGAAPGGLDGRNVFDFMEPEVARRRKSLVRKMLADKRPMRVEDPRDDRLYDLSAFPVFDQKGEVRQLAVFARDVTEARSAEIALKREAEVNEALASIADTILNKRHSLEDITTEVLNRAMDLTRSGQGFVSLLEPEENGELRQTFVHSTDEACQLKQRGIRHSLPSGPGGLFPGLLGVSLNTGVPFFTNDATSHAAYKDLPEGHFKVHSLLIAPTLVEGRLAGQIGLANSKEPYTEASAELLERIARLFSIALRNFLTEEALKKSEAKYRGLFKDAGEGIVVANRFGIILEANPWFLHATGYDLPEMEGLLTLALVHPGDARIAEKGLSRILEGETVSLEIRVLKKDGGFFFAEIQGKRVGINRVQIMVRDVDERKKLEQLKEDVDRITRHDLKTPLNAAINLPGFIMEDGPLTDDQVKFLSIIRENGYRMLNMINTSLDLFRMEQGTYEYEPVDVDLARVLTKVVEDGRIKAGSKEVLFDVSVDGRPLEPDTSFMIRAEELLTLSMLSNLVANAVESTPAGGRVAVAASREQDRVLISIHNDQPIPGEVQERFFEKYATFGKTRGTGLGTYSAKLMAQTQGGEISFSTGEEEGTTVRVVLPAHRPGNSD